VGGSGRANVAPMVTTVQTVGGGRGERALRLGVNIDHVATVRNARGGHHPDPVRAAHQAVAAGADGITAHLREDRRHIRDGDMARLKAELTVPLNFEMGASDEMVAIALKTVPHACCLVPERREERTTEGGLDIPGGGQHLRDSVRAIKAAGIRVSLFIEPEPSAIEAAALVGADIVEFHTGRYCELALESHHRAVATEIDRIGLGAKRAAALGLEVHAGHGLTYLTVPAIAAMPDVVELNIGHFLMGEALFVGLAQAISRMRAVMDRARDGA
jgi:pyridoxine 5-phosphate synthase